MSNINLIRKVANQGPYFPNWSSLGKLSLPSWFSKEKFGIFIHWGLYSVPAFNNEWYSRNMYIQGHPEFDYHRKTYGSQEKFGYKDFIPLFTAEKFHPEEWAELFKKSGARYVFPVSEHHDGFQMYESNLSQWNAKNMGPKRDIIEELKQALEKEKLRFCTSNHRAEHWFFMGHGKEFSSDVKEPLVKGDFYWPAMAEADPEDLYSQPYPSEEFLDDWLERNCEIVDKYRPKLMYFDWWIQHDAFKEHLKTFAAYYYNRAVEWEEEVAICYKHDAMMFGSGIVEIERGKFADSQPFIWQSDTAIARNSWCYTETLDYKSTEEIIHDLIEVVSKNGNLLLNVGPKASGEIALTDQIILKEIGEWLKINGEGIYESRPWRKAQEGDTQIVSGQFQEQSVTCYTSKDIRFTVNGDSIYAFVMKQPENKVIKIQSLGKSSDQNTPEFHGIIKNVSVLGIKNSLWKQTNTSLEIHYTDTPQLDELPIVCKIQIK